MYTFVSVESLCQDTLAERRGGAERRNFACSMEQLFKKARCSISFQDIAPLHGLKNTLTFPNADKGPRDETVC